MTIGDQEDSIPQEFGKLMQFRRRRYSPDERRYTRKQRSRLLSAPVQIPRSSIRWWLRGFCCGCAGRFMEAAAEACYTVTESLPEDSSFGSFLYALLKGAVW